MGAFAALTGPLLRRWYAPPCVAALWVVLEWTHPYTGLEWLNLGNAADDMSVLLRLAPVTGVWGLSFLFALMSSVIAALILRKRFVSFWLLALPGLYLIPEIPEPSRGETHALVVQPNLDGDTIWTQELLETTESQLRALSISPVTRREGVDVIVWPEMPVPFYANDTAFTNFVGSVTATAHAGVLAGVVGRTDHGAPLNSALLTGADGVTISRYDKVNLVPFGEYIPWPFAGLTKKISSEAGDFSAGSQVVVSKLDGHRIGTFICYESVFPSYVRRFAAGGAEVLFNLSNDGWFGTSAARYQHLRIVRMRAAELHRWIVRATNNGVSAAIDPAGRVVRELPEYRQASVRMPFGYRTDLTPYARFGDWFVGICSLVCVLGLGRESIWTRPPGARAVSPPTSSS
ncbi:MAG TPA: apolipoprotein N-acyltransferase, partial [Bryobacteraceae bacterium]|nr:apolipoprotein N-acyltransferase [Bryobacteraceae bacterium]